MALDQNTPVYAVWPEILGHTRKEFSPNKLFKPPMLDLINLGEQSPGKCFSFQLSSFWLCRFSFLNSRSLKMYFLKHFSLYYTGEECAVPQKECRMIPSRCLLTQEICILQCLQKVKTILISVALEKNGANSHECWEIGITTMTATMTKKPVWGNTFFSLCISPRLTTPLVTQFE